MAVKDILLAVTTYPEPTPVSSVDDAVAVAAALGAKISAIACEITFKAPHNILSDALIDIPAMAAAEARKSAANAENLLAAFQALAEKRGVFQDRILEHGLTMAVPDVLVDYARLRDLTIVPLAEGGNIDHWFAEVIIFGSGRPTMILPPKRQKSGPFVVDSVVVAWDFSRPAARAVADALPILSMAKKVYVVTVTDEKIIDSKRSGAELAKHLARHGVEVVLDTVDAGGKAIGDVLEGYVASRNADILVMGAFGHSRLRDFVMGGATKSMLAKSPLPVLLSH